ncbi:MAG: hypothetical protein AAF791_11450 [Bacteroidota bacterium]
MAPVLLVLNIAAILSILAWPVLKFGSAFVFDTPGSERNPCLWALCYTIWYGVPIAPVIGNVLFWTTRHEASLAESGLYTVISWLAILCMIVFFALGALTQLSIDRRRKARR